MPMLKFGVSSTGHIVKTAETKEDSLCLKCGSFVKSAQIDPDNKEKCPLCGEEGFSTGKPEEQTENA